MKNSVRLSLTFGMGGIIFIASFIIAWIFYETLNLLVWLWILDLAIIAIMVFIISLLHKNKPDERLMNILKKAVRNSWTILIVLLPITGTILVYITNNQVLNAMILFTTWNIALVSFGATILLQYWK
ncbi:MAG: hypothetical protein ACXABK_04305 [Candidatus Heimdallarchaeaceae archaeon]|jgi:uncharacterized membrane protein